MSNQFRLLLFIVVISGALCTVEDYVIMSQCAHNKAIHVAAEGTVSVTDISQTQNITIVGLPDYVNNNLKIALYAKETQRYLCFNDQWKLVGMKELRDTCYFNETIVHGYFVFRSVVDLQRRVGFTHRGKAVGPKKNVNDACYLFTKIQADQFFHQHTDYFAPKSKSTKIISGISNAPQTTTATHTTSGTLARSASQRAALSAAATTATVTATATQRNHNSNNRLLRTNNKNKRVNGVRKSNSSNNNRNSNNNQNEEYTNGHSSNLSSSSNHNNNNSNQSSNINHSNSSNLVSNSQQQVDLSQQRQHNNNSSGRTREHVRQQQQHQQQQHQVRHHHNDPNLVARRQHHEHKQKRRQHQRLRSGKITSPATTTVTHERATATTTTRATYSTTATGVVAHSKQQHEKDARHEPQAATVANVAAKAATATSIIMKSTTTIANKRKGRRRKGRKQRKQQQTQRAQQQMLPLVAREPAKAAHSPTPTTWLWSDSPTPPLYSLSTQMLADVPSSLSPATTFGDYSGEWMTSVPINVDATSIDTAAPSSQTPTLSTLVASDTPTPIYLASMTDLSDGASSLMPTTDYNNNTDFTSVAPADEESSLNATFITEIDESRMWPEPTIALDEQLNSITSEQQQQQFTTQNVATPVSTAETIAPTSTTWSESSEQNWSSSTTSNDTDDLETVFPSPTAIVNTESVAATAIFSEDGNVTEETQTAAEATDSYATSNSTSSEIEAESSSSTYNDVGNTEALTEVGDTQSTTTAQQKVYSLPAERGHIGHMWRKQSGIAASIATLLRQQLLATSASSGNVYAWRPQRGEEYSDEIIVATGRPVDAELETTTDVASGDRATWWQHHMNHSGTNFWDKGIADEVPSGGDDADLDWLKQLTKQRTASKRRHNNRKPNNNSSRDVEAVSQQPLQALSTSDSSLGFGKKYVPEGKSQRQSSKAHSGNNKSPAATTTAHEYSSTMATSRTSSATTHSAGVITPATTTARMKDNTLATTTPTQHLYPLQQLLGNKTVLPLHNPRPLAHFDGNSNHLAHTHTPTASTFSTTTSAAAPTSTTVAGDATTAIAALTTKKSIRISTQKLLATPFHQLTYVRNNAGDIDIDNMDNISVYPDLLEESGELAEQRSTERAETDATRNSRLTIVSGYLPTSATATLPESIRLAKVKINKERKRMMSLRKRHSRRHA